MKRRSVSTLALWALLVQSTAGISAEVPDRINHEKFLTIYEQKEATSKASRREASAKASVLRQRTQERLDQEAARDRLTNQVKLNHASIKAFNESNTSLVNEAGTTRTQINQNDITRENLAVEVDRLQTALSVARDELTSANADVTSASTTLNGAKTDLREASNELSRAQTNLREAKDKVSTASTEIGKQNQEVVRLEALLRQFAGEKKGLEDEMATLSQHIPKLRQEVTGLENAIAVMGEDLVDQAKEKTAAEQAVAAARQKHTQQTQKAQNLAQQLQTLTAQKQALEKAVTDGKQKIQEEKNAISSLDIEKQRLEETIPLLQAELDRLLKDKEPPPAQVQALKDQIAKARQDLLGVPGKKAEIRARLIALENGLDKNENDLKAVAANVTKTDEAKDAAELAAKEGTKEAEEKSKLVTLLAERLTQVGRDQAQAQQKLREAQEHLRSDVARRKEAEGDVAEVVNSIRNVEITQLPAAKQAVTRATTEKSQAENDQIRLEGDERRWQRTSDERQTRVNDADRALSQKQTKARDIDTRVTTLDRDRSSAISRRAELVTSNATLEKKIISLQDKVKSQQERIRVLDGDNTALAKEVDAVAIKIANAMEVEKIAEGAYQVADVEAKQLEGDTEKAKAQYAQVLATYKSEKGSAVAQAVAQAKQAGAREGSDRGTPDGDGAGAKAGGALGTGDGSSEGKSRDYEAALAAAHAKLLEATVAAEAVETPVQRAQRGSDSALETAYRAGNTRGLKVGRAEGLAVGDNPTKEEEGRAQGYAAGKRRAEDEAEKSHRPLGRSRAEAAILSAPPKKKEQRDATKEEVTPIGFQQITPSLWKGLVDWLLPSAVADGVLGVITPAEVPEVKFSHKRYEDDYPHPDFVDAYRAAYDQTYGSSYVATYIEKYRQAYQGAHAAAYAQAKAAALAVSYDADKQRGTRDGEARGTFDGLGYNAGKKQGFAEGKMTGEKTAFDRGHKAGEPKGHSDNLAAAQAASEAAGRADVESDYRNNAKLRYVDGGQKLVDAGADGKFELNEKVSLSGTIRNFGGVPAAKGSLRLEIDQSTVKGVELTSTSIVLGEIGADTEVAFTNLLVGKVLPGAEVALSGKLVHAGRTVAEVKVKEAIYAPYRIAFTYFYDPNAKLRVGSAGDGTGYHNAVWVQSLGGADLLKNLQISVTPVDKNLVSISWEGQTGEWVNITKESSGWLYQGFFMTAYKYQGLNANQFRVRLRNRAGQILFDKIEDAPVEVRQ